jgi:hypothetical protein
MMQTKPNNEEYSYIPGTCNLGAVEISRRKRIGWMGLIAAITCIAIIEYLNLSQGYRWIVFAPIYYSLSGFIQARHRFCYVYGWKGIFSIKGRKQFGRSSESVHQRADRNKAIRLMTIIIALSLGLTFLYVILSSKG